MNVDYLFPPVASSEEWNTYSYMNAKQKQMRNEKRGETETNTSLEREDLIGYCASHYISRKKIETSTVKTRSLAMLYVTESLMDDGLWVND